MKVVFLGFTMPDDEFATISAMDPLSPAQTQNFACAFARALRAGGAAVRLLSAAPVSVYPHHPRLIFKSGSFDREGIRGSFLPFVNATGLKHVTRFCSAVRQLRSVGKEWGPDWIIVHGVHSAFLWAAITSCPRGARVAVILTDPPGVVRASDGPVAAWLKRIDAQLVRLALARTGATIALTRDLARDFAPGVPFLVMEGILAADSQTVENRGSGDDTGPRFVLYAGALEKEYGVMRVLEAMSLVESDARLILLGKGEDFDLVSEAARGNPLIEPPRFVSRDELFRIYGSVDVLVQPRPADSSVARYSFPSKLIEYLGTGVPTVSTRLPGIPADYEPFVEWVEDDSAAGIASAIDRLLRSTRAVRLARGSEAARFVRATRSEEASGNRVCRFLERLPSARIGAEDE